MEYRDRKGDVQSAPRQSVGTSPRQARWSLVAVVAIVLGLGLAFYGIDASRNGHKAANPPAVIAVPAPASGIPPPRPQTTTGQPAPPIAAETTGRGETQGAH